MLDHGLGWELILMHVSNCFVVFFIYILKPKHQMDTLFSLHKIYGWWQWWVSLALLFQKRRKWPFSFWIHSCNTVLCVDETKNMPPSWLTWALTWFNTVVTEAEPLFPATTGSCTTHIFTVKAQNKPSRVCFHSLAQMLQSIKQTNHCFPYLDVV